MWTPATAAVGELTATWRDWAEHNAEPVQPDPSLLGDFCGIPGMLEGKKFLCLSSCVSGFQNANRICSKSFSDVCLMLRTAFGVDQTGVPQ